MPLRSFLNYYFKNRIKKNDFTFFKFCSSYYSNQNKHIILFFKNTCISISKTDQLLQTNNVCGKP